jgi:hypothetical protein
VDGYGSTECGGVTIDHSINRRTVLDAKLIDVPDLGKDIATLSDYVFDKRWLRLVILAHQDQ